MLKIRTTQLTVAPEGEPIFSESAYTVTIDDEAAGEFVVVHELDEDGGRVKLDPQNWPVLRDAIDRMVAECQS